MIEALIEIGRPVFSVFAMLTGAVGLIITLYQWIAADIFRRPLKVNGLEAPIGWPQRGFFAILITFLGCLGTFGAWLFYADWVVPAYVGLVASTPLWVIGVFVLLLWLFVTWLLNRSAGWPELRQQFSRPTGDASFSMKLKWAVMGKGVTCQNVITIAAYEAGFVIDMNRLFGPFTGPVLVPWDQLTVDAVQEAAPDLIRLRFGELEEAGLVVPLECWKLVERYRPANLP